MPGDAGCWVEAPRHFFPAFAQLWPSIPATGGEGPASTVTPWSGCLWVMITGSSSHQLFLILDLEIKEQHAGKGENTPPEIRASLPGWKTLSTFLLLSSVDKFLKSPFTAPTDLFSSDPRPATFRKQCERPASQMRHNQQVTTHQAGTMAHGTWGQVESR